MGDDCRNCPYIEALDGRLTKVENKLDSMDEKVNNVITENAETKVYFQKLVEKMDDLKELFCTKMFSFEGRLEKVEKAIEDRGKDVSNQSTFNMIYPDLKKLIIILLVATLVLAGVKITGLDLSTLLQ